MGEHVGETSGRWVHDRRLRRVQNADGTYSLLALDHPLTHGNVFGDRTSSAVLAGAHELQISGVVVNPGKVQAVPITATYGVILQTFGAPLVSDDLAKLPLLSPRLAINMYDPDMIAVELNLKHPLRRATFERAAEAIAKSKSLGMPTMIMYTAPPEATVSAAIESGINITAELGASVLKIGLEGMVSMESASILRLRAQVENGPDVVLAGGADPASLITRATLAAQLGFKGYCVGRSIFTSEDPGTVVCKLNELFRPST